jgi:uncharacterized protein YbjQ (UPF0145 family)
MMMQPGYRPMSMPVTTTLTIEGYRITRYFGAARGIIVRAEHLPGRIEGDADELKGTN